MTDTTVFDQHSAKQLGLDIFRPISLHSEDAVASALFVFEETIDEYNVAGIIAHALKIQHGLEYILSAVNNATFSLIKSRLCGAMPTNLDDYSPSSVPFQALSSLITSLPFHDYPEEQRPSTLDDCDRAVKLAAPFLVAIRELLDSDVFQEDKKSSPTTKRSPIRTRRNSKTAAWSQVTVDVKPFRDLGLLVPATKEDAEHLAQQVLLEQKTILEFLLSILRREHLAPIFKTAYLSQAFVESYELSSGPESALVPLTVVDETAMSPTIPADSSASFLKPSLYVESPAGFGRWRIYLSGSKTIRAWRAINKGDASKFEIIENKLKELSHGRFSETNQKKLTSAGAPVDIFEARLPGDLRIVYQIDCVKDYGHSSAEQVLTVFSLCDHAEVRRLQWDEIGRHTAARMGKAYCERCRARSHPRNSGDDVYEPLTFPAETEGGAENSETVPLEPRELGDLEEFHSLVVLEKYIPLSESVLNAMMQDEEVQHVFRVSPEEQNVIEPARSCYVIGRSGTGKTTTMLFKLFGIEKAWAELDCLGSRPRQVFVTKSRVLARKVEEYFMALIRSLALSMKSYVPEHLVDLLRRWEDRRNDVSSRYNAESSDNKRSDLAAKFSELKDHHFPLFITTDELARLIQADMSDDHKTEQPRRGARNVSWSAQYQKSRKEERLVTFDVFKNEYWPHLPQHLTKGLSSALVFGEFIGVIKGSKETLKQKGRMLTREGYAATRGQAAFVENRDLIYDLFQAYQKRKRERAVEREDDERDAADRAHDVLQAIKTKGGVNSKVKVDYLYVDEVQDCLLIETLLLRSICRNSNGLFWAGDTAQTVSNGSAFRFEDLRAFLYDLEQQSAKDGIRRRMLSPPVHHLCVNYRSHGGIVDCAHSVIGLLKFWPTAIDNLPRERGIVSGKKPVFIDHLNLSHLSEFFSKTGDVAVELGHEQCILVRDNAARERLEETIGDIGIVLTVYDSKGLEFDDVLLWNFFEDSSIDSSRWRQLIDHASQHPSALLSESLEGSRLSGLSSELKHLYVAITRARKNLWFVDRSSRSDHMKAYWASDGLINANPREHTLAQFARPSTAEDWAKSGLAWTLMGRNQYDQAIRGFQRAKQYREAAIACAYQLWDHARQAPELSKKYVQLHLDAARAFVNCAEEAPDGEKRELFGIAGECYAAAKMHRKAAEVFTKAARYDKAAIHYFDGKFLDQAVATVKEYHQVMEPKVIERIKNTAKFVYLNERKLDHAAELFSSHEEQMKFITDHDLGDAHAAVMEDKKMFSEAAEAYLKEGQTVKAIEAFLEDSAPESVLKAKKCLVDMAWRHMSYGIHSWPENGEVTFQQLQSLMQKLDPQDLDKFMINVFHAVITSNLVRLRELASNGSALGEEYTGLVFLCLDYLFDKNELAGIVAFEAPKVISSLDLFNRYVHHMHTIIAHPRPWLSRAIQKTFCFNSVDEDHVILHPGTYFHRCCAWRHDRSSTRPAAVQISRAELKYIITRFLGERLRSQIWRENNAVRDIEVFDLCFTNWSSGRCNRRECMQRHAPDASWFNSRARFYMLQILIVDILQALSDVFSDRMKQRRYWLDRLDHALNPMLLWTGSVCTVELKLIPEAIEAFHVVRRWLPDILYNLEPHRNPALAFGFVTNFMKASTMGLLLDRKTVANCYNGIPSLHWPVQWHPGLVVYRDPGSRPIYRLWNLVEFLQGASGRDLVRGVDFFRHIVERRVPIDLGVFCRMLQRLTTLLVMARSYQKRRTLHNVTLPRTWIVDYWADFIQTRDKDCRADLSLVRAVHVLLQQLSTNGFSSADKKGPYIISGYLHYRSKDIPRHSIGDVAMLNILRSVCLLGYHINSDPLRNEIVRAITSLDPEAKAREVAMQLYERYFFAKTWPEVVKALRQPSFSPLDELIRLHSQSEPAPAHESQAVRRVDFGRLDDIPGILDPSAHLHRITKIFNPSASAPPANVEVCTQPTSLPPSVKQPTESTGPTEPTEPTARDPENEGDDPSADTAEHELDEQYATTADGAETAALAAQRDAAARTLQRALLRAMRRAKGRPTSGLPAARERLFRAACTGAQAHALRASRYRCVLLALVPHALLCLEWAAARAREEKRAAKARARSAEYGALEGLMARQTALTDVLKRADALGRVLEPAALFHRQRDLSELRRVVAQVLGLVTTAGLSGVEQIREDLHVVAEWVGVGERPRTHPVRPSLNTTDL